MAEILGIGVTHSPSLVAKDEDKNYSLTRALKYNDKIPPELKKPESWPKEMQAEWGRRRRVYIGRGAKGKAGQRISQGKGGT